MATISDSAAPDWDSLKPAAESAVSSDTTQSAPDWDSLKPASEAPKETAGIFRRTVGDFGVGLAKSVVNTGQAAVGLADIPTLGKAGKALENIGVDFPRTQQILEEAYSPEQQEANRAVRNAEGFIPTAKAYAQNPSVIAADITESVGPMLLGQGIGGAAMKAVPAISRGVAGALGEGAVTAGSSAEQIREQTPGGELTPGQTALAAGSGALTGAITGGSNVLARKLGVGDINTLLIPGADDVAKQGIANKAKAVGTEAALEAGQETVQSGQEQAATNLATGQDVTEGLGNAMAAGAVTGGGMGLGGGVISQSGQPVAPPPPVVVEEQPKTNFDAVTENLKAQVGPPKGIATKVAGMAVDAGITPEQQAAAAQDSQPVNPIDGLPEEPSGAVDGPSEIDTANQGVSETPAEQPAAPPLDPAAASVARNALNTVQASLDKGGVMGTVPPVLRNAAKAVGVYDAAMAPDQLLEAVAQRVAENDQIENDFDFDESIPFDFPERQARPTLADQNIARDSATHDAYHAEDEQDEDEYLAREREIRRQEAAAAPAPTPQQPTEQNNGESENTTPEAAQAEEKIKDQVAAYFNASGRTAAPQEFTVEKIAGSTVWLDHNGKSFAGRLDANGNIDKVIDSNTNDVASKGLADYLPGGKYATPEAAQAEEKVGDKERYVPTNSLVEAAAVTEAAKRGIPDEQIEAGEYQRGFTKFGGLDIAIENGAGTTRSGTSPDGTRWSQQMKAHYGEIGVRGEDGKLKTGADGDLVDVFINPNAQDTPADTDKVFIVDQIDPKTGAFDESKVLLGYKSIAAARKGYLENYPAGWQGIGAITPTKAEAFKAWLQTEDATKPVSDKVGAPTKPSSEAGQRKLQVQTAPNAWQYVTESPEGLRYSIYPTDALSADQLEYAKAKNPNADFRVEPATPTSPDMAARQEAKNVKQEGDNGKEQSLDPNLEAAKTLLLRAVPDGDLMKLYGNANIDLRVVLFRTLSGDQKIPKAKAKSVTDLVNLFYDKAGIPMDTLAGRNAKFKSWTQGRFTPSTYKEENLHPYVAETRAQRDKDYAKANDATIDFEERVRNVDDLLAAGKPVEAYFLALKTKVPLYFTTEDDGTVTMASGGLLTNSLRASDGRQAIQNHKNREAKFRKQHGIAERKSAAKIAYEKENGPQFSRPESMTAIFDALLPESTTADKEYARQAMAAHPLAARMQYVEDNFYDLLLELEQTGKVDIQC